MDWARPSEPVRELIRHGAQLMVSAPPESLDELHEATLSGVYTQAIASDPVLAEGIRRSNRSNLLHWAAANVSHPGEPVPANLATESLLIVRDGFRRGLDESAVLDAYRVGTNVVWRSWMQTAFELTRDPDVLRELLDVTARSLTSFIDATIAGICAQMQIEREALTRGTHAERRETVALILDGAAITRQRAESRLGYRLQQSHTAAVIWADESMANLADLDAAAEALGRTDDGRRALSVLASAATRWVWVPGPAGPDLAAVATALDDLPGVHIAVGATASGIDGFRRSHLDAVTAQRMMVRLGSSQRVARFTDIELVALISADPELADRFITHTLGDLASADIELRETVLAFVQQQCNASRTAERMFTHRNTLLRRLTRANELLPRPLEDNSVHVAVALEALHWRGARQL
ncbi:PucR family transcriptional regulator [Mycolicibacter terrae]|uniref:Transcriptional regulator n=2 Tax=Mycolicibacter TaxID=1073531 RepID=A0A1A2NK20_MYCSD|nr:MULTISPECIES: PucR family transcriptional regulator [Mycolicibacter]OBH15410.1 transcriptional regulator [Mycolicibacter sinensis]OBI25401.1 transcriptional regulator [Mycolicibacter sinensis]RRR42887.1 PucR family transcriptional regulator [Mycolicibacter terrae]